MHSRKIIKKGNKYYRIINGMLEELTVKNIGKHWLGLVSHVLGTKNKEK